MNNNKLSTITYSIPAMHCPSCELLMQEEISAIKGVKSVKADAAAKSVVIKYSGEKPTPEKINQVINPFNYTVSVDNHSVITASYQWSFAIIASIVLAVLFFWGERLLITNTGAVEGGSVLRSFFFGLIASLSTCAALVGGLLLAQAKNWQDQKLFPYLSFNISRLMTFVFLGGLLGLVGEALSPSIELTAVLIMLAAIIMIILGLQMLDAFPVINKIKIKMPAIFSAGVIAERNKRNIFMPALLGAITFFLPCSFTLTVQLQAITEANAINGALVMGAFAVGTLPMLLFISFSSHTLALNSRWQGLFMKTAGLLVIIFALYTFNNQLNVLGWWSLTDLIY